MTFSLWKMGLQQCGLTAIMIISLLFVHTHHLCMLFLVQNYKSRKKNPQKLTQLNSRSHPRHLVGKKDSTKDITIDTTSDNQVNSNFPNRWSPASLTLNNYFYLFLYLRIIRFCYYKLTTADRMT